MNELRSFTELYDSGLWALINERIFNPRGYYVSLHFAQDGSATGWRVGGDGTASITHPDDEVTQLQRRKAREFFDMLGD